MGDVQTNKLLENMIRTLHPNLIAFGIRMKMKLGMVGIIWVSLVIGDNAYFLHIHLIASQTCTKPYRQAQVLTTFF